MLEYCPAPSFRREGIMLCFSMSQYMLAYMVPSTNCSSPVPAALMQPQTKTLPPSCLTQCWQHSYIYFPKTTSGHDVEHVHSVWSWPPCCSSVSGSWQSSYSLGHLYVEQQFFFSDPQKILENAMRCHVELPVTSMRE
ncbi:unnamed protein product [Staurois parvus]|uniref:Uncharacterized protein n=1 Tax=Staurois parvus TaxID=386267 RepID=A0ABN9BUH8_9NEOB|nr:unnamed protein product [Staurois parvus]